MRTNVKNKTKAFKNKKRPYALSNHKNIPKGCNFSIVPSFLVNGDKKQRDLCMS